MPPTTLQTSAVPSTRSDLPWRVRLCASLAYAADAGVPEGSAVIPWLPPGAQANALIDSATTVTDVRVERVQKDKVIKVVLPQLKETDQVVEGEVGVPVILVEMESALVDLVVKVV